LFLPALQQDAPSLTEALNSDHADTGDNIFKSQVRALKMTDGAAIAASQLESLLIFKAPFSQRKWLIERRFTRSK